MSGLLGLVDSAYHHLKHDEHREKLPSDPNEGLLDGGIGGFGSAANGTLTGRGMGGGLYGQKAGERQMEETSAEKGELESMSDGLQ
ncbi:hypothetical protein JCM8097_002118 [Rhodosporidiobolus ruineniae]